MYVKSGTSQKLQKMQIISPHHLHRKKEIWKEIVHRQREEGGKQEIVTVGEHMKCPRCNKIGRVVWISEDKKTTAIQCPAAHHRIERSMSKFGPRTTPQSETGKNTVFFVDTSSLPDTRVLIKS